MKKIFLLVVGTCLVFIASGQHAFRARISHDNEPLAGASVVIRSLNRSAVADSNGIVMINNIPSGRFMIVFSYTGFEEVERSFTFPLTDTSLIEIEFEEGEEEEEVIVRSTRSSRTIRNVPTRVETIDGEEVDEKNNMRPANVSMLLHESTGIQVQQTSATSANASIRIQGLDGRYTQLLRDGFPTYGGFSGGLSVLEIPPLDLKQVEVIKGPASTLYGGGAIAGVINFVTIEPGTKNYTRLLLNQSHIGQSNFGAFTSQRWGKVGLTTLVTANAQQAYDVDDDDFTEVPKTKDINISPKLFFYPSESSQFSIGHQFSIADRKGGDVQVIDGKADAAHVYFENNNTMRNTTTLEFKRRFNTRDQFVARQSISFFDRRIRVPDYRFKGRQANAYTDISLLQQFKKHLLITGINFIYDDFREDATYSGQSRNDRNTTLGVYLQDTWDANEKLSFENGIRVDVTNRYGIFVLPRISLLYRISETWSSRIGAGMGYKLPTLFTEQTEGIQYRNVEALSKDLNAESSYGGTADINFRDKIADELEFSLNHMFFYTILHNPLVLTMPAAGPLQFVNSSERTTTYGFETNAKFIFRDSWKLFAGFTLNETKAKWLANGDFLPLVPKTKLNLAFIYEKHGKLKAGLEGYRTGIQTLSDGSKTPSFWEFGLMVEKPFRRFSFYINFENFTDQRQSKFKRVVNGSHINPSFDEIWNHTEGFVVNGGVKITL
jgi:outer membrane receptor for ferrienterochelin and colicins